MDGQVINPFSILFGLVFLSFLFGCFVVIFHLQAYKINPRASFLATAIFLVGAVFLSFFAWKFFGEANLSQFNIIF